MKNSIFLGLSIIIGFALHAWISATMHQSNNDTMQAIQTKGLSDEVDELTEYQTVVNFKQAAVEQLSQLKGEIIKLDNKEYLYICNVDESESGNGLKWTHKVFQMKNDTLIFIPFYDK